MFKLYSPVDVFLHTNHLADYDWCLKIIFWMIWVFRPLVLEGIRKIARCENYPPPPEFSPWENYPQSNLLSTYKSYKWKKKQNYKIFCLEESCAIQHPYQNNQRPLWYTDDFTENTALRYFLYRVKKIQNRTKARMTKWHLLASCTSQGELKLGSQIIKFGK